MNDHELLELAAKAAGYDKVFEPLGVCDLSGSWTKYVKNRQYINGREHLTYWNPLTDDGDALRLAVTLQLTVANEHVSAGVAYCLDDRHANQYPVVRSGTNQAEVIEEDYAATRRAIVRAAAEIGKEIP